MFSAARTLAGAAPGSPGDEDLREAILFERMYRTDFSAREVAAISEHLRSAHAR